MALLGRLARCLPTGPHRASTKWRCFASSKSVQGTAPLSTPPPQPQPEPQGLQQTTYKLQVTAKDALQSSKAKKLRLDAFLSAQLLLLANSGGDAAAATAAAGISRAKIQASIAGGMVLVNGARQTKAAAQVKAGDVVWCTLLPPLPLKADPEDIPLDIKYEDEHLLVINKAAGMVVHISPGHYSGTLVNALLAHCRLPPVDLDDPRVSGGYGVHAAAAGRGSGAADDDDDDAEDEDPLENIGSNSDTGSSSSSSIGSSGSRAEDDASEADGRSSSGTGSSSSSSSSTVAGAAQSVFSSPAVAAAASAAGGGGVIRPGIVHRLDKGTSGLLVVAKTDGALLHLQAQFKARTVRRNYTSITVGCPAAQHGRVETNIVRDEKDRKRMAAAAYGSKRGRTAASNYWVEQVLAGGGAAVVRWQLDTGRTHQIRVHAKHIGHPLFADETYGGAGVAAAAAIARRGGGAAQLQVRASLEQLGRPALHARTLGFVHPATGKELFFEQQLPEDFEEALRKLKAGLMMMSLGRTAQWLARPPAVPGQRWCATTKARARQH